MSELLTRDQAQESLRILLTSLASCVEPHARHPDVVQVRAGRSGEFWSVVTDLATYASGAASESVAGRAPVAQSGEQERFDAWVDRLVFKRPADGGYGEALVQIAWEAWQARAAAPIADEARAQIQKERDTAVMNCTLLREQLDDAQETVGLLRAAIAAERGETK